MNDDTITAIATPPGRAGIGIVRISGPDALAKARLASEIVWKRLAYDGCEFSDFQPYPEDVFESLAQGFLFQYLQDALTQ